MKASENPGALIPGASNTALQADPSVPGQWPATPACDRLAPRRHTYLRARHWALMSCAAAIFNEQPSPRLVRDAARHLCDDITQLADTTITALENTEPTA